MERFEPQGPEERTCVGGLYETRGVAVGGEYAETMPWRSAVADFRGRRQRGVMKGDWSESIIVVDLADEPALSDELAAVAQRIRARAQGDAGTPPHVVLNFSQVSYLNSSNLAQLLTVNKLLREKDRQLKLCSVSDQVWSVFLVTGLDKILRFAPDPMTALASIQIEAGDADSGGGDTGRGGRSASRKGKDGR